jgi:ketosteroid isomerase-like protein
MKILGFIATLLLLSNSIIAQKKDSIAVHKLLETQNQAWNNGDVEGFMNGYWNSDSLMFIGKTGVTYGYQNTLENYKKSYPTTEAMGKLTFTIIKSKQLSALYYTVVGKWHLQRSTDELSGHFTILLKKIKKQWVIVMDHSS